eukprot:TRINITY_DN639_c0_g1_i3.p1 TRINITY_DN639_c0_g1~~TRINITY_DN639_c0_g1_i3.p1  ORF type:complete len:2518 (-),score=500.64 TRINITY_DN639_c0_g1_i3:62-7615(-)
MCKITTALTLFRQFLTAPMVASTTSLSLLAQRFLVGLISVGSGLCSPPIQETATFFSGVMNVISAFHPSTDNIQQHPATTRVAWTNQFFASLTLFVDTPTESGTPTSTPTHTQTPTLSESPFVVSPAINPVDYDGSAVLLGGNLTLFWRLLPAANSLIEIALLAQGTGWVGIGFGGSGMTGSDIALGAVVGGVGLVRDYWSPSLDLGVILDTTFSGSEDNILFSTGQEVDGVTSLKFVRKLLAQDSHDRSITSGPMNIIVAFHPSIDVPYYHGVLNRERATVTFYSVSQFESESESLSPIPTSTPPPVDHMPPIASVIDPSNYPVSQRAVLLSGRYNLYWRILRGDIIEVAVRAATLGFVGFGIGENAMYDADIVIGMVVGGVPQINDYWALGPSVPTPDTAFLGTSSLVEFAGSEVDGYTSIVFRRPLRAIDVDPRRDNDIGHGPVKMICSMGSADILQYHGPNNRTRATQTFYLLTPYVEPASYGSNTQSFMDGQLILYWRLYDDYQLEVAIVANTTGSVGVGFDCVDHTNCDMVVGWVTGDGVAHVDDYFSTSPAAPVLDSDLGGSGLLQIAGSQDDGWTTIKFVRALTATHFSDNTLPFGFVDTVVSLSHRDGLTYHTRTDAGSVFWYPYVFRATVDHALYRESTRNLELLEGHYRLYWRLKGDLLDQIEIAVEADHNGWVGFGIGNNGMILADIAFGWINAAGDASVTDRYAKAQQQPSPDTVFLDSGDSLLESAISFVDGVTQMKFTRYLTAQDGSDNPIPAGPVNMIAAMGPVISDQPSQHASTNRTRNVQTFWVPLVPYVNITNYSPVGGRAGTVVSLTVINAGIWPTDLKVMLSGVECPLVAGSLVAVTADTSTLSCVIPTHTPAIRTITIQRLYQALVSPGVPFDYIEQPVVTAITPGGGYSDLDIVITGTALGAIPSNRVLSIGNNPCTELPGATSQRVVCHIAAEVQPGAYPLQLRYYEIDAIVLPPSVDIVLAPVLAAIEPAGGAIGASMTIYGSNFGATDESLFVTIGTQVCDVMDGSLGNDGTRDFFVCIAPYLPSGEYQVVVRNVWVNEYVADNPVVLYEAVQLPVITGVEPLAGFVGDKITLTGTNFGDGNQLSIWLGTSGPCDAILNLTATSVICVLPQAVPDGSYAIRLRYYSAYSAPAPAEVLLVHDYVVSVLSPAGGQAPMVITLQGSGFGTDESLLKIAIGDSPCLIVPDSLLDTGGHQLACVLQDTLPLGHYQLSFINLLLPDIVPQTAWFVAIDPTIEAVGQPSASSGDRIAFTGNFGFIQDTEAIHVLFNGDQGTAFGTDVVDEIVDPVTGFATTISCVIPDLPIGTYEIQISHYNLGAAGPALFVDIEIRPELDTILPGGGVVGSVVTITGSNFGTNINLLSVFFGPHPCPIVPGSVLATGRSLACQVPNLPDAGYPVTVIRRHSPTISSSKFIVASNVSVNSFSPLGGNTGSVVSFFGSFGADDGTCTENQFQIALGTSICSIVAGSLQGCSSIACVLVNAPLLTERTSVGVSLTRLSVPANFPNSALFVMDRRPSVQSVTPRGGRPGSLITVSGVGFSSALATRVQLVLASRRTTTLTTPLISFSSTELVVQLPSGFTSTGDLSVFNYELQSVTALSIEYITPPNITTLSPLRGITNGLDPQTLITVTGSNFGTNPDNILVNVGGLPCTTFNISLESSPQIIVCEKPFYPNAGVVPVVVSHFEVSSSPLDFTYELGVPHIEFACPETVRVGSGENIFVIGTGFQNEPTLSCFFQRGNESRVSIPAVYVSSTAAQCPTASIIFGGVTSLWISNDGVVLSSSSAVTFFSTPARLRLDNAPETDYDNLGFKSKPFLTVVDENGETVTRSDLTIDLSIFPLGVVNASAITTIRNNVQSGQSQFLELTFEGVRSASYFMVFSLTGFNVSLEFGPIVVEPCPSGRDPDPSQGYTSCTCGLGYQPDGDNCVACPKGTYKDAVGSGTCTACPLAMATLDVASSRIDQCVCIDNYYRQTPVSDCIPCPAHFNCLLGQPVTPEVGYWRVSNASFTAEACINPSACTETGCADHYHGPLCSLCDTGYGRVSDACLACPPMGVSIFLLFLLAFALLFILTWMVKAAQLPSSDFSVGLKIAINYLQVLAFLKDFLLGWPDLVLSMLQVPSTATPSTQAFSLDCVFGHNYPTRIIFIFIMPFAVVIVFAWLYSVKFFLYLGRHPMLQPSQIDPIRKQLTYRAQMAILCVLFLMHPSVIRENLIFFNCEKVGGHRYLRADMSVDCDSTQYKTLLVFAVVFFVFYSLGMLALLFFLLWRNRLTFGTVKTADLPISKQGALFKYRFLISGYHRRAYFWECVVIGRKIVLVGLALFVGPTLQIFFGIILFLFCIELQRHYQPYNNASFQRMETVSLWTSFSILLCGIIFNSSSDQAGRKTLAVLLVLLNCVVFGYFIILCVQHLEQAKALRHGIERISTHFGRRMSVFDTEMKVRGGDDSVTPEFRNKTIVQQGADDAPVPDEAVPAPVKPKGVQFVTQESRDNLGA